MSRTDHDAGYMVREGKPKEFFYLDHRTVDGRHAIITDTHVRPASVHDSVPYLGWLDRQRERFYFSIRAPTGNCCPIEPPTAKAIVSITPIRNSASTALYVRSARSPAMQPRW